MKAIYRVLIRAVVVTALFTGCATDQSQIGGFNLISVGEEKQLGDKFAVEIEKEHRVVNDPEVQSYISEVGKRLLSGAQKVEFPFTFKVVEDPSVNAFAIPGGHTYVNTGLIKAASSETELAAVMAHEINHVVARHATKQMTQQYGYALVLQLLLGQNPGMLSQLATQLFGKAGSMYYSRGMESQADYLGVETMYRAGYNPEGMVTFFEKLEALNKKEPGKLAQLFASHPLTSDRIENIRKEIAKLPPKQFSAGQSAQFERIKERVQHL